MSQRSVPHLQKGQSFIPGSGIFSSFLPLIPERFCWYGSSSSPPPSPTRQGGEGPAPAPGFFLFKAELPVECDVTEVVTGSLCFAVFERYKSYSPYDIKESIRKEVKGDLEKSFLTLGNAAENSPFFLKKTAHLRTSLHSGVLPEQTALLCQQTQRSHEGTRR